jgi:hypothetical protein
VHAIYSVEELDGAADGVGVGAAAAAAAGVALSVFVAEGLASLDEPELSLGVDFEPRLSVL